MVQMMPNNGSKYCSCFSCCLSSVSHFHHTWLKKLVSWIVLTRNINFKHIANACKNKVIFSIIQRLSTITWFKFLIYFLWRYFTWAIIIPNQKLIFSRHFKNHTSVPSLSLFWGKQKWLITFPTNTSLQEVTGTFVSSH